MNSETRTRPPLTLLITTLDLGGAETQAADLAIRLASRGWPVSVVSVTRPGPVARRLGLAGVPVASLDVSEGVPDPRMIPRLLRIIEAQSTQVLHTHMVHANILGRIVGRLARTPVVVSTAHSINEGGRLREIAYRLTDPLADMTTQVSNAGAERYLRAGAVRAGRIRVIPNGVDTERFRPDQHDRAQKRSELLGQSDRFVWLAVGRLDPPKDHSRMLEAFDQARTASQNPVLLLVGEGPMRASLEEEIRRRGIAQDVRLLGTRSDIPSLLRAADGFVSTSIFEGLPVAMLEAGATGLPVVSTDVGGSGEVVQDGATGYLTGRDPADIASVMRRLMSLDEAARTTLGRRARTYVQDRFDLDRIVDTWEGLYWELLDTRDGGHRSRR